MPLDDSQLWPLTDSGSQGAAILRQLECSELVAPEDLAVVIPDESDLPEIRRSLRAENVPHHYGPGSPLSHHSVGRLLSSFANFHQHRDVAHTLDLLRHPRMRHQFGHPLGKVINECYQAPCSDIAHLDRHPISKQILQQLNIEHDDIRPLAEWHEEISTQLRNCYQQVRAASDDANCLQLVASALQELRQAPESLHGSLADAFGCLLDLLNDASLPEHSPVSSCELIGPLEAAWEEAPWMVITRCNEGAYPGSIPSDSFWPDSVRRRLGLSHDRLRFARDLAHLHVVINSRKPEQLRVLIPRLSGNGDPLVPSRLLFQHPRRHIRARALFGDQQDLQVAKLAGPAPLPTLNGPQSHDQFLPPPVLELGPLEHVSVTALRTYLRCPYRFYLQHVLKLRDQRLPSDEWDAPCFGTLIHDCLQDWAESDARDLDNAEQLYEYLHEVLNQRVDGIIGPHPSLAIRLQVSEARRRLQKFASQQAQWRQDGWQVIEAETAINHPYQLSDGSSITLIGKIDRIDQHPDEGKRIIDYKTADRAKRPWSNHVSRAEWTDLQLPAYQMITGIDSCGYWNLSPAEDYPWLATL